MTLIICPWGYLYIKQELAERAFINLQNIWPDETFIEVK